MVHSKIANHRAAVRFVTLIPRDRDVPHE